MHRAEGTKLNTSEAATLIGNRIDAKIRADLQALRDRLDQDQE